MATLEQLNFEVNIPNEDEFNQQIDRLKNKANELNSSLSSILDLTKNGGAGLITKEEHDSTMRYLKEEFAAAQNAQRLKLQGAKEGAKMAQDEAVGAEKVSQAVSKTNQEKKKELALDEKILAATKQKEAAETNATTATLRKTKAEHDAARAETQRATAAINQAAAEERKLTATNRRIASEKALNAELERQNRISLGNSRLWRDIKNLSLAYFSIHGATQLVRNLVNISAEFEKQRVSLHAILQDANGAERIFAQIKDLAVQSPFQFKELVTYAKQLSAFSIPIEELYDTTKMLADVSAGLGVGMDRLVLAYGQIRSASFLRGQEVRQLTEAGIPILEELRKQFEEMGEAGITAGQVFDKISARQVTFEMVQKVFRDMTSEGGKFYQMQEVLAQTLSGKLSNLTDAYQIMFSEIGEKTNGVMVGTVDALRKIAENYENIGRTILELVAAYGVYRGTLIGIEALNKAFALSNHKVLESIVNLMKQMKTALLSNPYALLAAGATTAAFAIYKLTRAIAEEIKTEKDGHKILRDFNKGIDEMEQKTISETAQLDKLYAKLKTATEGTQEYDAAKRSILNQYDTYISKMREEGKEVDDLIKLYGSLKKAVQEAAYDRYRDMLTADAKDAFDNAENDIMKAFNEKFTAWTAPNAVRKASETQKEALWLYVTGARSAEELVGSNLVSRPMLEFFKYLKNEYKTVSDAYTTVVSEVDNAHTTLTKTFEDDAKELNGWQKKVMDTLEPYSADIKKLFGVDAMSNWSSYVDDVQRKYKELNVEIAKNTGISETAANTNRQELAAINALNTALGGRLLMEYNITKATTTNSDNRIEGVEAQIKVYQKLKDAYADLTQYISDSEARAFLATMFPDEMAYANFDMEIRRLAASLLDMGEAGAKAAMAYDDLFRDDKLKEYIAKLKQANVAAEEYDKMMEIWEKFIPDKEGIDQIVDEYTKTIAQIDKAKTDSLEALYAREGARMDGMAFGPEFYAELQRINSEYFNAVTGALDKANRKLKEGAKEWVESWLKMKTGMDFDKIGDLTIRQLGRLEDGLEELAANPAVIFEGMGDQIKEAEFDINEIVEAIKAAIRAVGQEVDDRQWDDVIRKAKMYRRVIDLATTSIKKLGEATGNPAFEKFADDMDRTVKTVTTIFEAIAQDDMFGATMAALTLVVDSWVEAVSATLQYKRAVAELESQFLAMKYAADLSRGVDTIFGKNTYQSLLNARNVLGQLNTSMLNLETSLNKITISTKNAKWWQFLLAPTAPAAWFSLFTNKSYSVMELLEQSGASLKDELGRINVEALEAVRDGFDNMSQAEKDALDAAIRDAKAYNEALEQLNEAMEDLVGGVADDFADAIIDQWKEAGDAAADYGEILDDIASQYAKMYVRDTIMQMFNTDEFKDQLEKMTIAKDAAGVMGLFESKLKELEEYYPFFEDVLNSLSGYFTEDEATKSNTLGGGIKSITEDTANLLASYVNAIRADVAAIRQAVVAGSATNVPAPTLAEYLTQIQANTYNTAQNTAALLDRISSVMTVTDGPAFRVFM